MKIRLGTLKQITLQVLKFMNCEIPSNSHLEAATAKNYFAKISSLVFRQYFIVGVLNEMLLNWFWYLICACKNQRDYFLIGIFIYKGGLKERYGYCSMIIFFVLWVSAHYNKKRRSMNFMVNDLSRLNFFSQPHIICLHALKLLRWVSQIEHEMKQTSFLISHNELLNYFHFLWEIIL